MPRSNRAGGDASAVHPSRPGFAGHLRMTVNDQCRWYYIDGKYLRPDWSPPVAVKRDKPALPDVIAGGSPRNPMGEATLTLSGGEYAIHGTNVPGSVGGFVSYGCIRMYNHDIVDLYGRVRVGTPVVVTR